MNKRHIIAGVIFFLLFLSGPALWLNEQLKIQKTMNGIHNLKLLGQAILLYKEKNLSLPIDLDGKIFFSKLALKTKSLKEYATPDIYHCRGIRKRVFLPGFGEKYVIASGCTVVFFDPFSFSRYQIKMFISEDGSVITEKIPVR